MTMWVTTGSRLYVHDRRTPGNNYNSLVRALTTKSVALTNAKRSTTHNGVETGSSGETSVVDGDQYMRRQ